MPTILAGRYELVRKIGAGGMGRVFAARDIQTDRMVAAKIMMANTDDNLDALLRFYQEGAVLSTMKHPNIVEVYGTYLEDQTCSIMMELLEGQSLSDMLKGGRPSLRRTRRIMLQVAAALEYAHGRGIVHRDIKPGNIMVGAGDRVNVTDFGIARILRSGSTLNTATGLSLGTPLYMAPEQVEAHKVDGRADIYSLGAVMYQMVSGQPPFGGEDPLSVAFKHVHTAPEPPSSINTDVPPDWEALILKALAKDPARRFQTAGQMREAIEALSVPESEADEEDLPLPVLEQTRVDYGSQFDETSLMTGRDRFEPELAEPRPAVPSPVAMTPIVPARPQSVALRGSKRMRWIVGGGAAGLIAIVVIAAVLFVSRGSGTANPTSTPLAASLAPITQFGSTGSAAGQFRDPEGIAVDGQGNIYVADYGNNRVQKLSATGAPLVTFGSPGSTPGQFNGPSGIAVDAKGNIYVADSGNSRIQKLDPSGNPVAQFGRAGSGPGEFNGVHSVALDAQGNIYAADFSNNRIQKLSPSGKVLAVWGTKAGGSAPGQFKGPVGVAVDKQGNVYVADFLNNRVQKLSPAGAPLVQFTQWWKTSTAFGRPHAVAVDNQGNIYAAEFANNVVEALTSAGQPVAIWGEPGTHSTRFGHPVDVTVDGQRNLYVADGVKNRIQKFAPIR